ncbi:hypothetical protein D3C71_1651600 [compost metagenome]
MLLGADECLFAMCYRLHAQLALLGRSYDRGLTSVLDKAVLIAVADCVGYTVVPASARFLSIQLSCSDDH